MATITAIPSENGSGAVINNDCNHTQPFSIGSTRFIALRPSKVINHKPQCSIMLKIHSSPFTQSIEARLTLQ